MFSLIVVLIDRQGTEEGEEGTSQKLRRDPRCSTFFLSFHVTADEYSRAWKISISLNQGGQIFIETGSRNRAPPLPLSRGSDCCFADAIIIFYTGGEGGGGDIKREMVS